jgi:hypothetical protein
MAKCHGARLSILAWHLSRDLQIVSGSSALPHLRCTDLRELLLTMGQSNNAVTWGTAQQAELGVYRRAIRL